MKAVVREKRIPFDIRADNPESIRDKAIAAYEAMRQTLSESDLADMPLEDINAEIKAARNKRREKGLRGN